MSEEGGFGISWAQKIFGLIIAVVGAFATYCTVISASVLSDYVGLFGFLSIFLLALGVFLIIAKTE
jgi:hypothetical protein